MRLSSILQRIIAMAQTYVELQQQIAELQEKAEELRQNEIESVVADIKEKIAAYGLTAKDLGLEATRGEISETTAKIKKEIVAKYRNPETGDEWSGRGRPPKWLQEQLNAGKAKEDFLIV
jgi:DNA-binding protein H-NS